jgi:predicted RND superfamily exporter protein
VTAAALEAAPGAAVASLPRLVAEVQARLGRDLRRLGGWALAAVAAVMLVSFRGRPLPALLALAPVALGLAWTLGLAAALGLPLDPFSLQVAPLLLGIGVDNGLHVVHGARAAGGGFATGGLQRAVAAAGRAIALCTLTNAVGFGSLALSRLPALSRGGLLVAAGALLCLAATLVVLPAAGALAGRRAAVD